MIARHMTGHVLGGMGICRWHGKLRGTYGHMSEKNGKKWAKS
jgi:hypothetical protein